MAHTVRRAATFTLGSVATTLVGDLFFSLLLQPPPSGDLLRGWWIAHVGAHAGVLIFGFTGAALGYLLLRARVPSAGTTVAFGAMFGLISIFAAPAMFMRAGLGGAVAWLLLGSSSIALGSGMLRPAKLSA